MSNMFKPRVFVPLCTDPYYDFELNGKKYELRKCERQFSEKFVYPGKGVELRHGYSGRSRYGTVGNVVTGSLDDIFKKVNFKEIEPRANSKDEAIKEVLKYLGKREKYIAFEVIFDLQTRSFYHFTKKENIESILNSCLFPGRDIKKNNIYNEMKGDPSYAYLYNTIAAVRMSDFFFQKCKDMALLEINLPLSHPIKRDYDQLLYIFSDIQKTDWKNIRVKPFLKRRGIKFKGKLTKENLIHNIDLISEKKWAELSGSYRTPKPISKGYIEKVDLEEFERLKSMLDDSPEFYGPF